MKIGKQKIMREEYMRYISKNVTKNLFSHLKLIAMKIITTTVMSV